MKRYARTIAIAVAMGILGFFATVGFMTVLLAPGLDSFALKTSADAASWVQAIGSIVAIVAAYFYGADQARRASESALNLYRLDKARTEEGCRAIVFRLRSEVGILARSSAANSARQFREAWSIYLISPVNAALHAFDSMPLQELGAGDAVLHACEIRSSVEQVKVLIETHMARWLPNNEDVDAALDERREEIIDEAHLSLRNQIGYVDSRLDALHADFAATKRR